MFYLALSVINRNAPSRKVCALDPARREAYLGLRAGVINELRYSDLVPRHPLDTTHQHVSADTVNRLVY